MQDYGRVQSPIGNKLSEVELFEQGGSVSENA